MSETVIEKGKLTLIERLNNETLEEQCKRILSNKINNYDLGGCETYEEALLSEFYDRYYVYNDNLYNLNYDSSDSYEDIVEGTITKDGEIDFFVSYYNGGACLHEMLDMVMEKIDNKIEISNANNTTIISTCLKCGSNDISIEEDISYDCDECPYVDGYYLQCNCCGEINYN